LRAEHVIARADTRRRLALAVLAAALLALPAGCGDSPDAAGRQEAPQPVAPEVAPVSTCAEAGRGWSGLAARSPAGPVPAAVIGTGAHGVVLANDSANSACPWTALARTLAARGYRVAVFTYASSAPSAEPDAIEEALAVLRALRRTGGRVAIVGASLGGRVALQVAAQPHSTLSAVVNLSGERAIDAYPDILPAARRVHAPTLHVSAAHDPFTDSARQTRQLHAATRAARKTLLIVPGAQHGTQLLANPRVRAAILRILATALS
jgi:dienelactone hydrolase